MVIWRKRKLSYAGRLILIKAVLSSLHSYWARIFILPKTVIGKLEAICRSFLWYGNDSKESPMLVSWETVCRARKQRGLGIRDFHAWNLAAIGKYAWWVAQKTDHLWVKWVHAIYIKNSNWEEYEPGVNSSWAWRKICQVKHLLKDYIFRADIDHYNSKIGYQLLKPDMDKVTWYPWVLNQWIIPKQAFLCWLIAHHRLTTQDRLLRMHIIQSNLCFLCGLHEESHEHLFFSCAFSQRCRDLIANWCLIELPSSVGDSVVGSDARS
ncbi:uncharacterized protein LOC141630756 [Silene latifolia]|uniref:uncharacterized protein LOC141630756 n=1 Tax=Silene latifolia TaxID=37657 RepID=UPI003D7867CC